VRAWAAKHDSILIASQVRHMAGAVLKPFAP